MNAKLLEILKEKAPTSLVKNLTNIISKEDYKDGDISKIMGEKFKTRLILSMTDEERLDYLMAFSKFYVFGKKDNEFLEKEKKSFEKENDDEQIRIFAEEKDIKKLKEELKKEKNRKEDISYYMNLNPENKAVILEAEIELFEEGFVDRISIEAYQEFNTEEEKMQLKEILGRRTGEFSQLFLMMTEIFHSVYSNKEEDVYEEECYGAESIHLKNSFQTIIENIVPTIGEFFESGAFKEEKDRINYKIDQKAINEVKKMELIEAMKYYFIIRVPEKKVKMADVLKLLINCLTSEELDYDDLLVDYTKNSYKHLDIFYKNIENLKLDKNVKEKVEEVLEYILLLNPEREMAEKSKREKILLRVMESEIFRKKGAFEKIIQRITIEGEDEIKRDVLGDLNLDKLYFGSGQVLLKYFYPELQKELEENKIVIHPIDAKNLFTEIVESGEF